MHAHNAAMHVHTYTYVHTAAGADVLSHLAPVAGTESHRCAELVDGGARLGR